MQELNIQNLIKAGVHFGHEIRKWNPKMKPFVHTEKNGIHIIDLEKTIVYAQKAMEFLENQTSKGLRILFVGTKPQALTVTKEAAEQSSQFYVNKRWLGGTLTNFETLKVSIDRMKRIQKMKERFDFDRFSKKEKSRIEKEYNKKDKSFCGIKDMKELPSVLFIVDIKREKIALSEARRLSIPIVALVDTNCDPGFVDFPIPANDDSVRSIQFFTRMAGEACQKGWQKWENSLRDQNIIQRKMETSKGTDAARPAVVNINKSRKLVAVGTAEEVEIKMELEKENKSQSQSKEIS